MLLTLEMKLLAQVIELPELTPGAKVTIEGPVPQFGTLADVINKLLPILFSIAGLILFFYLISGGFDLLLSGGDPKKAESAKGKITNAVVGFIIIFIAWWLTQILAKIFALKGP